MKSHKIQRLEFISDKIEGGDCKREVICIRFGHPTKKTRLCEALHGRAAVARVGASMEPMGSSPESGKVEGERGRGLGCSWGAMGRGCYGGGQPAIYLFVRAAALCSVLLYVERKKEGGRRKREEKKRKERKRKK
jgi:hypothetical protein